MKGFIILTISLFIVFSCQSQELNKKWKKSINKDLNLFINKTKIDHYKSEDTIISISNFAKHFIKKFKRYKLDEDINRPRYNKITSAKYLYSWKSDLHQAIRFQSDYRNTYSATFSVFGIPSIKKYLDSLYFNKLIDEFGEPIGCLCSGNPVWESGPNRGYISLAFESSFGPRIYFFSKQNKRYQTTNLDIFPQVSISDEIILNSKIRLPVFPLQETPLAEDTKFILTKKENNYLKYSYSHYYKVSEEFGDYLDRNVDLASSEEKMRKLESLVQIQKEKSNLRWLNITYHYDKVAHIKSFNKITEINFFIGLFNPIDNPNELVQKASLLLTDIFEDINLLEFKPLLDEMSNYIINNRKTNNDMYKMILGNILIEIQLYKPRYSSSALSLTFSYNSCNKIQS